MGYAEPLRPELEDAMRTLAERDISYADAGRALAPVATRIRRPRPSYWTVLAFMREQRQELDAARRRREHAERKVGGMIAGRVRGV